MNPLIGVIVGGVLALLGSFGAKLFEEWLQVRALRGAFRAEIEGLLDIAAIRRHEEVAEGFIAAWKSNNPVPFFSYGMELASRNPVFSANVGRIGSIGRQLAGEVTAFYARLLAVRISSESFDDPRMQAAPLPEKIAHAEAALAIWRKAKADGAALVAKL